MERFAVETLDEQDRAFVESMMGINRQLQTLKLVFPDGRKAQALDGAVLALAALVAAALE